MTTTMLTITDVSGVDNVVRSVTVADDAQACDVVRWLAAGVQSLDAGLVTVHVATVDREARTVTGIREWWITCRGWERRQGRKIKGAA